MKNIKQIRENFDLITEKEEKESQKLSALVRAGLYDAKKLPALKKALEKTPDKMTGQEKRMLVNLLDSLIAQVTSDEQIYRKVKQNVHTMNEAKMDTYSKLDPRFKEGYPSDKDIPTVLILKRKAIRVYPDNQKVALYYSQALDKYVTIPFSDIQTGINEAVQPSQNNKKKKNVPQFNLKPKTTSSFKPAEKEPSKSKDDEDDKNEFQSLGTRARALSRRGINAGGIVGTIAHDIAHGKFKKKESTPETKQSEPAAAAKPKSKIKKVLRPKAKPVVKATPKAAKPKPAVKKPVVAAKTKTPKTKTIVKPKATAKTKPVVKTKPKTTATKPAKSTASTKTKSNVIAAVKTKVKTKPAVKTPPKTAATKPAKSTASTKTKSNVIAAVKTKVKTKPAVKTPPKKTTQPRSRVKRSTETESLPGLAESFAQKLQTIRENVLKRTDGDGSGGTEGYRAPRLGGGGGNPSQIPYGGINPMRQGSGELARGRTISGALRRAQRGATLRNPLRQSPAKVMRKTVQDVKQDITNVKNQEYGKNVWKKQADVKAPPKAKPVQSKDTKLKDAPGSGGTSAFSDQKTDTDKTKQNVIDYARKLERDKQFKSDQERTTRYSTKLAAQKQAKTGFGNQTGSANKASAPASKPSIGDSGRPAPTTNVFKPQPKKTEVVPGTAPQVSPPAIAPASKPDQRSVTAPAPAARPTTAPRDKDVPYKSNAERAAQVAKNQKELGQNAAANNAATKAKRARDEKALRNKEQKNSEKGKRPRFGAALAAAALATAGAAVSPKFVKKADTKDSWALQKRDIPDTQQRRMQQANRRALETTNESVLSTIKDMVDNGITEQTVTINEQEININNTVAKKIMLIYESVNSTNKKKMEKMLNESAASFNKVLTFAIRQ